MREFSTSSPEDAIDEIAQYIPEQPLFVRIDGHSGVGKSRVAKALAQQRKWIRVELDQYVRRELPGKYADKIDRSRLHRRVHRLLRAGRPFILDGICMDAIVPAAVFGDGFRVYVQCEASEADSDSNTDRARDLGSDRYHRLHRPDEKADLIVTVPYSI